MLDLAQENLAAKFAAVTIEGKGPYFIVLDGDYDASVLLDTAFWNKQDEELGEIIAVPLARDLLVFADRSVPGQEDVVRNFVEKWKGELPYPISERLLAWRQGKWEELKD